MTLQVGHLLRECKLYERHVRDLEQEVAAQAQQIQEATHEHRETIRLLAELRLDQEAGRWQQRGGDVSRRLDTQLRRLGDARSTPHGKALSVASAHSAGAASVDDVMTPLRGSRPESVVSLTSDDGRLRSDGGGSGGDGARALSLKHFQMIDELNRLQREVTSLKSTNRRLEQENRVLTSARPRRDEHSEQFLDAVEGRRKRCESGTPRGSSHVSRRSSISSMDDVIDVPSELLSMKEKHSQLKQTHARLLHDFKTLQEHMLKQQASLAELQLVREGTAGDVERVLTQQVTQLTQQRDELLTRLEQYQASDARLSELFDRKCQLESELRREQEVVRQRTHEKDKLEIELLRERLAVERQLRQLQRLEELLRHKDGLEEELYQQRGQLQHELSEIESRSQLSESRGSADHQQQLQQRTLAIRDEIKEKAAADQSQRAARRHRQRAMTSQSAPLCHSSTPLHHRSRRDVHDNVSDVASVRSGMTSSSLSRKLLQLDCGCVADTETMLMRAQCDYHVAVERLRKDLKRVESRRHKSHRK